MGWLPDRRGIKGLETEVRAQGQPEAIAKKWPTWVWLQERSGGQRQSPEPKTVSCECG